MFRKFLALEWKAFTRSASFSTNLALKILMGFLAIYFTVIFLAAGIGAFYLIREEIDPDPLRIVNRFMIYYLVADLIVRLMLQKIPVMNIRPFLTVPIPKKTIVNFAIGKTAASFFNFLHWFFLLPFAVVLTVEGYDPLGVWLWFFGIIALIYTNNFLNILLNNKDGLFYIAGTTIVAFGALQYYGLFDLTAYTFHFFDALYKTIWAFLIPVLALSLLYRATFTFLRDNLHLDTGLSSKHAVARTEQFTWLDKYGTLGTFLKNDIRLIKRNKRSKTTILMSVFFLFYGFLFLTGSIEAYDSPLWKIFAGIFISGGFLFTFGQFVPSWDSAYYPLMMTQNISYREYITSKWWLVVIATLISMILSAFYLYFGWQAYAAIIVGGIYNIGVNSHLVLLGGAFIKTPIDLSSGKGAFGDKKAFNMKTMLLVLPKLLLPMVFYAIGSYFGGDIAGYAVVALMGVAGFAFRNPVFRLIEKIYKTEKYQTLAAYKQNNE